jgi:hypothetical protein
MRCKDLFILAGVVLAALGCTPKEFQPQTGDLLFQVGATGDMTEAIALATGDDSVSYTHMAIAVVEPDGVWALEASGKRGVVMTPLAEFLAGSAVRNGRPVVAVGRLKDPRREQIVRQAVARAKTFMGQPYDDSFLPDNGKMYCSELVWESFRDADGPVFESRPMNFRASDGTMPQYWVDHFASLGQPVPEGVPGTNPVAMSRDGAIRIVHRY